MKIVRLKPDTTTDISGVASGFSRTRTLDSIYGFTRCF